MRMTVMASGNRSLCDNLQTTTTTNGRAWNDAENHDVKNGYFASRKLKNIDEDDVNTNFIRRLANDHINYKLYGKGTIDSHLNAESSCTLKTNEKLNVTAQTLRRVSKEFEVTNSDFFESVWKTIDEENAGRVFRQISDHVLAEDRLNWGRVVSLITFGGKLAEWFWGRQQKKERIDEVEDWIANSLCEKEDWIESKGGWDDFNRTFASSMGNWWKSGLYMGVGVSIAALCLLKTFR